MSDDDRIERVARAICIEDHPHTQGADEWLAELQPDITTNAKSANIQNVYCLGEIKK